jgi:hypothetical protein
MVVSIAAVGGEYSPAGFDTIKGLLEFRCCWIHNAPTEQSTGSQVAQWYSGPVQGGHAIVLHT